MATCIAVHFAVCHALYNNKNKKIDKNRCLVFLNDLVLFCSVIGVGRFRILEGQGLEF